MRDDFSKQLVERERIHSWDKFHNYRHKRGPKGLQDDEVGGRESMRRRFNHGYERKSFNENLNPLYGWLRSCVGKNWDKCYSELRKKFDARSVINDHILQHLWQSIETHTFVDEHGRSMARAGNYSHRGAMPVSECGKDYYVCPKSGMVRATQKKSYRQIQKLRAAEAKKEKEKVERWLDEDNVLRFIDGVWYHFELRDTPIIEFIYVKPMGKDQFSCGTWGKKTLKRWEDMNHQERREHGTKQLASVPPVDLLTGKKVYRYSETIPYGSRISSQPRVGTYGELRYHATKKQASHKLLKEAGLV